MAPPGPEDVRAARQFVRAVRSQSGDAQEEGAFVGMTEDQMNSMMRLGARFVKGFRGEVELFDDEVYADVSVPVPWITGQKWANISGIIPQFEDGFEMKRVVVSGTNISPDLAMNAVRVGGNLAIGEGVVDRILEAPQTMHFQNDIVVIGFGLDEVGQNGVVRGVFGSMRGEELPGGDRIVHFEEQFIDAMEAGDLGQTGSYLPYITFLLDRVFAESNDDTLADNYTAAIIALAKICGARDFSLIIGGVAFDQKAKLTDTTCENVTFNDRIDSRRHFTTAAALQAASNRGFSVSVGEFKELFDAIRAGGFDFTDLAANNSGIRLSDVVMGNGLNNLDNLRRRIQFENDVIILFDDIPPIMSEADFDARFKDIDSPEYKAVLDQIETLIDGLPIYQP